MWFAAYSCQITKEEANKYFILEFKKALGAAPQFDILAPFCHCCVINACMCVVQYVLFLPMRPEASIVQSQGYTDLHIKEA